MKRITSLLLALMLVLCFTVFLTGCGEEQEVGIVTDGIFEYELVDGTYTVRCIHRAEDGEYTETFEAEIPSTFRDKPVTAIGDNAFVNCKNLTKVTMPDSITSIGMYAFNGCVGLTDLWLSDNLTYVGAHAFGWVSTEICNQYENGLYYGSAANPYLYLADIVGEETVYRIHADARFIGDNAFFEARIKSVSIPAGVMQIGNHAFYGCNKLEIINFEGTVAQWGDVVLVIGWRDKTPATGVICTDGQVDFS